VLSFQAVRLTFRLCNPSSLPSHRVRWRCRICLRTTAVTATAPARTNCGAFPLLCNMSTTMCSLASSLKSAHAKLRNLL
jgi:hypothetical protein